MQAGQKPWFPGVGMKNNEEGDAVFWLRWVGLGAVLFSAYLIFFYADLLDTYENSILFLKSIAQGNLRGFYSYTIENSRSTWAANYDAMIYVVYGLWNLPVLLLTSALGIDYFSWTPGLLWCKTLGVLLCLFTAWLIWRILLLVGTPRRFAALGSYLYMSSLALFLIAFVVTQVDFFSLALLTGGFYFYLKKRYGFFFLCFAVAMPCKMFALFLFLPLLLLIEKKIVRIAAGTALIFSVSIASGLFFGADPAYGFALGSQSRDALIQILEGYFFWGHDVILFVLFYMVICVACYLYRGYQENREAHAIPVYCAMAVWVSFVCFVNFNSYWVVYVLPFLIIGIVANGRFLKACCFLELLFSVGYVGVVVFYCSPLADQLLTRRLLLPRLFSIPAYEMTRYGSLNYMVEDLRLEAWGPFFSTCMMGALLILLVLTCPFLWKKEERFVMPEPSVLLARILFPLGFLALLLYASLKTAPPEAYSTFFLPKQACETDLIAEENTLEQEVVLQETRTLEELQLFFRNPDYVRNNFSSVRIEILRDGETVFRERVGCAMIESGERLDVKLGGLVMEAERPYCIRLTGILGSWDDRGKERQIFPYVTRELADPALPAVVNGEERPYNLYFRLR